MAEACGGSFTDCNAPTSFFSHTSRSGPDAGIAISRACSPILKTARYCLPAAPATVDVQITASPSCESLRAPEPFWLAARTSSLVSSASVKASLLGRSPPNISGLRAIDHSVIRVRCSSWVKRVGRSSPRSARMPMRPRGSMSASGQAPGLGDIARRALAALQVDAAIHLDDLLERVEDTYPSELIAALFELEMLGLVKQL